jgi:hypothetical protein
MHFRSGLVLALPLLLSVSTSALAAATPEEAARLKTVFQSYLGTTEGVVTVKPSGDNYSVILDVAPLAKKAQTNGVEFSFSPIEMMLNNKGEGKWGVSQDSPISFDVKAGESLTANFKVETYRFKGVFDEKLSTFESASSEMKNLTLIENTNDPAQGKTDISVTIKDVTTEQSAVSGANGGVDLKANYKFSSLSEIIHTAGDPTGKMPPLNLVVSAETGTYDTTAKGLKAKSMLDIVAFFISHQSKDQIVKDQATLKTMLNAALPLFDNVSGTSTLNKFSVASPIGPIAADTLTVVADINGFVKDGKLRESLSLTGLAIPAAIVPPWATTLVPKNLTFDFAGSGFDLAAPGQLILSALDLAKDPPLPANFETTLMPSLLPTGAALITLNPTSISNDLYNFSAEGSMTAGPAAQPSGKALIKAKGLDEVMKVIQAAPPEMNLQSYTGMILGFKGMAKAEADGGLSWNIETSVDGKVTVNGIDMSKLK